ncbi:MAG: tyrosine-type recombinase/integrase [Clostridia bacterium]|nr:tyrosine-type recombinase/integrase [Clostridia bacterium]
MEGVGIFMEIGRMIALYMEYCRSKQLRPKTMLSYEQTIKLFARWLKEVEGIDQVEQIKEATIRHYILELQSRGKYTFYAVEAQESTNCPKRRRDYKKPVGNITINNYLRNLSPFFTWLVEIEYIPKSPMTRVKSLPQQRPAKEYLEDEEVKVLLKNLDKTYFPEYRDLLIMMIMLDSGTRLGETLSIEMNQIDLLNRTIQLPAEKTKGRMARVVFFSRKTEKELRHWIQFKDRYCESDYAFPVKYSGRMLKVTQYEANFRRYLERTGIKKHISPHTLRNNFAKRCLMSGMDIYTLSRILGHSSVTVTEKAYLDIHDHDLKKKYYKYSPLDNIFYG